MKRPLEIASLMIFVSVLVSCTLFLKKPEVKFSKVEVESFKEDVINLNVTLEVNNPNSQDLKIDRIRYAFQVNDSSPFKQEMNSEINFPANKKEKVVIPVIVPTADLVGAVFDILSDKPLKYNLAGSIKVNGSEFPFAKQGVLPKLLR